LLGLLGLPTTRVEAGLHARPNRAGVASAAGCLASLLGLGKSCCSGGILKVGR